MINFHILKPGLSKTQFYFFIILSLLWLSTCIFLLILPIRDFLILFGEYIKERPLNNIHWHSFLITFGISGITIYIIAFFTFFYNDFISQFIKKYILCIILINISLFFIFIISFQANWIFGDDHQFITTTAIDKYIPLSIGNSRFYPLGHFHYNLPLFIFRLFGINTGLPVEVHFLTISLFFIITSICLLLLFNNIEPFTNNYRNYLINIFFAFLFIFLESSFAELFLKLIYSETQIIMLFSIFILAYYKALNTKKLIYYIIAIITSLYSIYCKEPVFGVFIVIALTNFLFNYNNISKQEKYFYIILILNGIVFLILYYFFSFINSTSFYNESRNTSGIIQFLLFVFSSNPILIIMFLFGFIRLYFIILKKDCKHLYYDSLLFSGIAYTYAFFLLKLGADYYYMPSIILFLPSLIYWIKYIYKIRVFNALLIFFMITLLFTYNSVHIVNTVKYNWQQRKSFIPSIDDLLIYYNKGNEFIWYESDNSLNDNTFYITVRDWKKYVLNTFLNYQNKSEDEVFFSVKKYNDCSEFKKNILFFYPDENDQYQPMPYELVDFLHNNNFVLINKINDILIYTIVY